MFDRGFKLLTGQSNAQQAVFSIFRPGERIGIKINTLSGKEASTRPELATGLAEWLVQGGLKPENIIIWDRMNRELRDAGYRLRTGRDGIRIFGTDSDGIGHDPELIGHLNIGSLFSSILKNMVDASISLAILKDHCIAGVTAGMKNYYGAVHNPNKYHDTGCNPYIAELFDSPPVRSKHRLSVIDSLIVQYHRGPAYNPRWSEKFDGLIFSLDAVAADRVGWKIIEKLRSAAGLPSLRDEGREPAYLHTAEKMGLGNASDSKIELIEETV